VKDNISYYDEFAKTYEARRGIGYHAWLDDTQAKLVRAHATGGRLLEVGCGTGLILDRLRSDFDEVVGVDLSEGMLEQARLRGLNVQQSSAESLPFEDNSFDMVCSFKVLAHVQGIRSAALEMARVLKPGGIAIAEFYNPRSVRGAIWSLKPGGKTGKDGQSERDVYVRFDSPQQARAYFPESMEIVERYGLRVITPLPIFHKIPLFDSALQGLEGLLARPLAGFGSFYDLVLRKE
jgi:ubiquinone/menaquinone biosynthesis C-methylase UbiE